MIRTGKSVTKGKTAVQSNKEQSKRGIKARPKAEPDIGAGKDAVRRRGGTSTMTEEPTAAMKEVDSLNSVGEEAVRAPGRQKRGGAVRPVKAVKEKPARGQGVEGKTAKVSVKGHGTEEKPVGAAKEKSVKSVRGLRRKTSVKRGHADVPGHTDTDNSQQIEAPAQTATAAESRIPEKLANCVLDYSMQTDLNYVKFLAGIIEDEDSEPIVELNSISTYQGIVSMVESINKTLQTETLPSDFAEPLQETVTVTHDLEVEIL